MPTVAPGWPNPYSSHKVSTDTIVRSNLAADGSKQMLAQPTTGGVTTEIGKFRGPTSFLHRNVQKLGGYGDYYYKLVLVVLKQHYCIIH